MCCLRQQLTHLKMLYLKIPITTINPFSRIHMKFNSISVDPVQISNFLHKELFWNAVRRHKEFKCWFYCQDTRKPIPTRKLYQNCKFYPFLNHILFVFHFVWLLGCALAVDYQTIFLKGRHVYKMRISYKNKWGGFQVDDICDQGYTYAFSWGINFLQRNTHRWEFYLYMLIFFLFF